MADLRSGIFVVKLKVVSGAATVLAEPSGHPPCTLRPVPAALVFPLSVSVAVRHGSGFQQVHVEGHVPNVQMPVQVERRLDRGVPHDQRKGLEAPAGA